MAAIRYSAAELLRHESQDAGALYCGLVFRHGSTFYHLPKGAHNMAAIRYSAAELLRHESQDAGALRRELERALEEKDAAISMALELARSLERLESRAALLWDEINMKDKDEGAAFVELEELLTEELFSLDSRAPEAWPYIAPASFPFDFLPFGFSRYAAPRY